MIKWCGLVLLVQGLSLAVDGKHDAFSGNTAHGIKLSSPSDAVLVRSLINSLYLDEWRVGVVGRKDAVVMATPEQREQLLMKLDRHGVEHYVAVNDVADNTAHGIKLSSPSDAVLVRSLINSLYLDEWRVGVVGRKDAVVMATPEQREQLLMKLDRHGVEHYVAVNDVAEMLDKEEYMYNASIAARRAIGQRLTPYSEYPRYDEMLSYMQSLANQYPDLVTLVTPGLTYEGREFKYLKISTTNFEDQNKPIYFINAGIHAREWVTMPVALYTMHKLLEDRAPGDQDLIEDIDWIIIPCSNPDGYEFSHTNTRLWRRTRSIVTGTSLCRGVDGNRNFDYNFGQYGVSSVPCVDTYLGPSAFSEVETQYVRDALLPYIGRVEIFLDVHSYGNMILYGFDDVLAQNSVELHHVGSMMGAVIDTLKLPQADHYIVGNGGLILYPAAGNAQDWAQSVGVPLSFTLELPDMGGYWFTVPPEFIDQINTETWAGIAATARLIKLYHQTRS